MIGNSSNFLSYKKPPARCAPRGVEDYCYEVPLGRERVACATLCSIRHSFSHLCIHKIKEKTIHTKKITEKKKKNENLGKMSFEK